MDDAPLRIGARRYEPTAALLDGEVEVEGFATTVESAPVITQLFQKVLAGDLDVCELGLTFLLRTIDAAEHGVRPEQCSWVIGGTNYPVPAFGWIPQPVPEGVEMRHAEDGATLGAMLESGEIDALISVETPRAMLQGSTKIACLFPHHREVERDWFARTGILPMMHTVVVRRELVERPGLVQAVQEAFTRSKDVAAKRWLDGAADQHVGVMVPWITELLAEDRALLGDDWWPYGIEANRPALEAFLRYHHEQGLTERLLTIEDVFVPQLLHT